MLSKSRECAPYPVMLSRLPVHPTSPGVTLCLGTQDSGAGNTGGWLWVPEGTGQCCPAPWALHPVPVAAGHSGGSRLLWDTAAFPQELHMAPALEHPWQWLCVWARGVTAVSIPKGWLCHALLDQGSEWWRLMVPLELLGMGLQPPRAPLCPSPREKETWRLSGGTWPCSILLEKGLVGNLVSAGPG